MKDFVGGEVNYLATYAKYWHHAVSKEWGEWPLVLDWFSIQAVFF